MKISEIINKKSSGNGDCFVVSGKFIMDNSGLPELRLVHSMVTGQGKIRGIRHPHAWVEIGDVVIDRSNNRNIIMRKEDYYRLGKIKKIPGQYVSYSVDDALEKLSTEMTYGPWDLDD